MFEQIPKKNLEENKGPTSTSLDLASFESESPCKNDGVLPGMPDVQNYLRTITKSVLVALSLQFPNISIAEVLSPKNDSDARLLEVEQSEEERAILENILGAEVLSRLEALGFDVQIDVVADDNGKYIFHLGQQHNSEIYEQYANDTEVSEQRLEVFEFQQQLREAILLIRDISGGVIFSEGFTDKLDESNTKFLKYIEKLNQYIPVLERDIITLDEASSIGIILNFYITKIRNNSMGRNYISPELANVSENAEVALRQFVEVYDTTHNGEDEALTVLGNLFQKWDDIYSETPLSYINDNAALSLYAAGEITMVGGETEEANGAGVEIGTRQQEARAAYRDLYLLRVKNNPELLQMIQEYNTMTTSESTSRAELNAFGERMMSLYNSLEQEVASSEEKRRLDEIIPLYEAAADTAREEVLLNIIGTYNFDTPVSNAVVVYGSRHDFTNTIEQYNLENLPGAIDRGLISIKMRSVPAQD